MRIQHNIAAMNAYRNYNINTSAVSKNLEKLSSGYKINRAGDDAAGLAISEKMRAQITGLDAASKNVKDGISLVKTAEGAMQEVQDMLNRMVNLATQSANGTYDNEVDRANLQKEVDQLQSEINRIADSANFNGIKLLDGSQEIKTKYNLSNMTDATAGALTVVADGQMGQEAQVGILTFDLKDLVFSSTSADTAGDVTFQVAGANFMKGTDEVDFSGMLSANGEVSGAQIANKVNGSTIEIDGVTYDVSVENEATVVLTGQKPPQAADRATAFNVTLNCSEASTNQAEEIAVVVRQEPVAAGNGRMYAQAEFTLTADFVKDGGALKIGDTTYTFAIGSKSKFTTAENVIDLTDLNPDTVAAEDLLRIAGDRLSAAAVNNKNFYIGTDKMADGTTKIRITEKEGGVDYSKNNLAGEDGKGSGYDGTPGTTEAPDSDVAVDWKGLVQFGTATVKGTGLTLQIGDTSDSYNQLNVNIGDIHTKALGISNIDISTQVGAANAVNTVKNAINSVSSIRGTLGATQNRLEHTQNNLSVMKENIQDAESTIRDTDVAEEMMAYTKNNILVQSAQAMLAQANQIPQGVLQLLG